MSKKIFRAGLVPYVIEDNIIYYLMMKPSNPLYGGNEFQIAKGRMEEIETDTIETAIREGQEELGFIQSNAEFIKKVGVFLGRTTIFVAKIKDKERFSEFHFETSETKWLNLKEFSNNEIGRKIHFPVLRKIEKFIISNKLI